jgi:hypothetical protein
VAKITVLVCDECASQDQVKHYEVKESTRRGTVDLCGDHSKWVEELLGKAPKASQKPRASRSRTRKVTTMDEIEALKKS